MKQLHKSAIQYLEKKNLEHNIHILTENLPFFKPPHSCPGANFIVRCCLLLAAAVVLNLDTQLAIFHGWKINSTPLPFSKKKIILGYFYPTSIF